MALSLAVAALGLALCAGDYNLVPLALVVASSKIKWGVFDKTKPECTYGLCVGLLASVLRNYSFKLIRN